MSDIPEYSTKTQPMQCPFCQELFGNPYYPKPLDVEATRQQLRKEIEGLTLNLRNAIELFYSGQNRSLDVDRREQLFVDEVLEASLAVLGVVGLTEGESNE